MFARKLGEAALFWILWSAGTCLGALALGLAWNIVEPFENVNGLLLFLLIVPLLTMFIGLGQWLALRWWLPRTAWWILASIPGGLILMATVMYDRTYVFSWFDLSVFFSSVLPLNLLLVTCFVGFLASFSQWLVIQRDLRDAGWCLPVNILCLGLAWPFGEALGEALGLINTMWPVVLGWALTGLLSGVALAWLVAFGRRQEPERAAWARK